MSELLYQTTVTAIGELVPSFVAEGMVVFFGENAPEELHSFCVLHKVEHASGELLAGDLVLIDGHEFEVLAVGPVASENLMQLGHLNLKANGLSVAELPGDVCIAQVALPEVVIGSTLTIKRNA
ncbi:MAG: PTS glucitol/sorbitol transporter subunit IIA [Actinobacteria bacterium]|jgi:PTS system glucitol/sorbitol-specific IIA component|nr:PTS glucitol/sorbitol transporter subunit IIA [Actinomycetota bacterium]MDA2975081.1 PTS glucitol/sorbitol transporter subunit IIA [Actinomycetota bacterium]